MKKALFLSLFALSLFSCDRFTDGVIRDIDLPAHEPKLVGSLLADASDTSLVAIVSKTKGLLDTGNDVLLENAMLNLYLDNDLLYSWDTQDPMMGYYNRALVDTLGAADGTFKLEVQHPDFETIYATDEFPSKAVVSSATIDRGGASLFGMSMDEFTLSLQDIPGENQHYIITLEYSEVNDPFWYDLDINTEDTRAQTLFFGSALLLSESGIDADLNLTFTAFLDSSPFPDDIQYRIKVKTLSKAGYFYYTSIQSYDQAQSNPFSEPVLIYSNMEGGYGAFILSQTARVHL